MLSFLLFRRGLREVLTPLKASISHSTSFPRRGDRFLHTVIRGLWKRSQNLSLVSFEQQKGISGPRIKLSDSTKTGNFLLSQFLSKRKEPSQ